MLSKFLERFNCTSSLVLYFILQWQPSVESERSPNRKPKSNENNKYRHQQSICAATASGADDAAAKDKSERKIAKHSA